MIQQVGFLNRYLMGITLFKLKFINVTGLLIRAPIHVQAYRIGGADIYPMITKKLYKDRELGDQVLEVPYIPGSSFKGRMRSLLELSLGLDLYTTDQKIWSHIRSLSAMGIDRFIEDVNKRDVVDELFGWPAANFEQIVDRLKDKFKEEGMDEYRARDEASKKAFDVFSKLTVTRLLFSDFYPSEVYVRDCRKRKGCDSVVDFLEEKSDNRIDRITAAAEPRNIVRVVPGVEFEGIMTMLIFDNDKDMIEKYLDALVLGLSLLEATYLGASGSRGYGRIEFSGIGIDVIKITKTNGSVKLQTIDRLEFKSDDKEKALEKLGKSLDRLNKSLERLFE